MDSGFSQPAQMWEAFSVPYSCCYAMRFEHASGSDVHLITPRGVDILHRREAAGALSEL